MSRGGYNLSANASSSLKTRSLKTKDFIWIKDLNSRLSEGVDNGRRDVVLGLPSILKELRVSISYTAETGLKSPTQKHDRLSLRKDLETSIAAIGKELKSFLEPEISNLNALISKIDGSKLCLMNEQGKSQEVQDLSEQLISKLNNPAALAICWNDTLDVYKSTKDVLYPNKERSLIINNLRQIAEESGHEWKQFSDTMESILRDAGNLSSRTKSSPKKVKKIQEIVEESKVKAKEPLRLCDVFVWIHVKDIVLPEDYAKVVLENSQIEILNARKWKAPLLSGTAGPSGLIIEDFSNSFLLSGAFPNCSDSDSLARITIENSTRSRAVVKARELLDTLVSFSASKVFYGEMTWTACVWKDGSNWKSTLEVSVGSLSEGKFSSGNSILHCMKNNEEALKVLSSNQGKHLNEGYIWQASANTTHLSSQRVGMTSKGIEMAWKPDLGANWQNMLTSTYASFRAEQLALMKFSKTVNHVMLELEKHFAGTPESSTIDKINKSIQTSTGQLPISLSAMRSSIPLILPLLEKMSSNNTATIMEWGDRTKTPKAWKKYLTTENEDFNTLIKRSIRQRNNAIHNSPIEEVLLTVDVFFSNITRDINDEQLRAIQGKYTLSSHFEKAKIEADARQEKLDKDIDLESYFLNFSA